MYERNAGKVPASSPDGLTVFQTYTNLVNSERETLWARHNALILANSLIIGALAISPAALWENTWAALAMLGAGLLICAAWFKWQFWHGRRCGGTVILPGHLPHLVFAQLALLVISVFILMYLGLGYVRLALV